MKTEDSSDTYKTDLKNLEDELKSCQKKNEELTQIIADMEKTQQRLIEENNAVLSVKVVNDVEVQTDQERKEAQVAPIISPVIGTKEPAVTKKDDRQKLEESSRYATSVGVRT